jgi:hypothetical protein
MWNGSRPDLALIRDEPGGPFLAGASSIETHTWSGFGPYAIPRPGDSYGLSHPWLGNGQDGVWRRRFPEFADRLALPAFEAMLD